MAMGQNPEQKNNLPKKVVTQLIQVFA